MIALALVLSACQCQPVKPVTVDVPVPVPCAATLPQQPTACTPADTSRPEYLRCRLIDDDQREAYTRQIEAALKGCVGSNQ